MRFGLLLFAAGILSSCGYHIASTADALPKSVHTIAVPAFGNVTTQYHIADLLAGAVTREFIARTRYRVVANPSEGDAILYGAVVNSASYPIIFDPIAGRATGVQAVVTVNVSLRDKAGNLIYQRPNFEIKERYEISVDPTKYFDESEPAMQRLAQDVARSLVSAVLEKF